MAYFAGFIVKFRYDLNQFPINYWFNQDFIVVAINLIISFIKYLGFIIIIVNVLHYFFFCKNNIL